MSTWTAHIANLNHDDYRTHWLARAHNAQQIGGEQCHESEQSNPSSGQAPE